MASVGPDETGHRTTLSALSTIQGQLTDALIGPLTELEQMHAPRNLFVAGDVTLLRHVPKVSIVGSRRASEEGLRRASKLARQLVERDVVVVSGLAEGIDTAAHRAAMEGGGHTIAVIGTPLDRTYPRQNAELQAIIARDHVLVSQFPPDTPTRPFNFPMRNRTMALLVHASVIVEAGETSGSLSQGWEALRLGRRLFLLKSIIERTDLDWPHQMLGYGAEVLEDVDALLDVLPTGELAAIPF
jgi:DNA processing protein